MAHFDINEFTIAPENSPKIGRSLTTPYGARPGIGRCFHIQTPAGARAICDHARENSLKSSCSRAIIKFAGDVQIGEIVRCQFYL